MLVSHMKRFIFFFCLQSILLNFMHENISSPDNMISFGFIYEKKKILTTIISQKFIRFHGWKSNAIIKKFSLKIIHSVSFIKKNCLKKQINLFQALKHFFCPDNISVGFTYEKENPEKLLVLICFFLYKEICSTKWFSFIIMRNQVKKKIFFQENFLIFPFLKQNDFFPQVFHTWKKLLSFFPWLFLTTLTW